MAFHCSQYSLSPFQSLNAVEMAGKLQAHYFNAALGTILSGGIVGSFAVSVNLLIERQWGRMIRLRNSISDH